MRNIKIVRLRSGEDIMADYVEINEYDKAILGDPMHVIYKKIITGQTVMFMMPWLPIEILKENTAEIYIDDILTVLEPKDSLIKYYHKIVDEAHEKMKQELNLDYYGDIDSIMGDSDEEETEEITDEEIESILREKKVNRLH